MRTRTLLAVVAVCAAAARGTAIIAGTWEPIKDINDPHVQELGSWAVAEHAKQAPGAAGQLTFHRVTSGETQEFVGTNFRLLVDASDAGGKDGAYRADVLEQCWINTRKLVYFGPAAN